MANTKISALPSGDPAQSADLIPIDRAGVNAAITAGSVAALTSVPVSSVFSRTGAVVATSGDYTVAQVTGAAPSASPSFTGTVTLPANETIPATGTAIAPATGTVVTLSVANGTQINISDKTGATIGGGANALQSSNANGINLIGKAGANVGILANGTDWNIIDGTFTTGISGVGSATSIAGTTVLINASTFNSTGLLSRYGGITTVDNGVPSELGHLDITAKAAALAATTIYTPTATGRYRISVYAQVTVAATTSCVLGGTTGFTLTYTDGTAGNAAQSLVLPMATPTGVFAINSATNSTANVLIGNAYIYAKTGVAIKIAADYTSVGGTTMKYELRATCEAM